jgi:hypothetical protein
LKKKKKFLRIGASSIRKGRSRKESKVFCFFFSKKKVLLHVLTASRRSVAPPQSGEGEAGRLVFFRKAQLPSPYATTILDARNRPAGA